MSAREAFGPNLRRLRMQRGISLEFIARETKVSVAIWTGLEKNDLSRWPTGIYARAYVRSYAQLIGVDPEATAVELSRSDRRMQYVRALIEEPGSPVAKWSEADVTRYAMENVAHRVSQFLHGEQGALLCTARIVETVPWIDAKYYA